MINPILEDTDFPNFAAIEASHVIPAAEELIKQHRQYVDTILQSYSDEFNDIVMPSEQADFTFSRCWSRVSHLSSVKDTPEFREAYNSAKDLITEYFIELGQNKDFYDAFNRVHKSPNFHSLDEHQQRIVEVTLRNLKLSGVALEADDKILYTEINKQHSKDTTAFGNAVLDSTEAWTKHIVDESDLSGLSETEKSLLASYAEEKGLTGWVVNLRAPSVSAILTYADDRDLRFEVYKANNTRASDQFFDTQFDNSWRINNILELRAREAKLLGFNNSAELSISTKMADTTDQVLDFLYDIADKAKPFAEQELQVMKDYAAGHLSIDELMPWDTGYVANVYQKNVFDLDQEVIKGYFPKDQVMDGITKLFEELYGITLYKREVSTWNTDVVFYDVLDELGLIAGVYVDLYARSGKKGGAWMDTSQSLFANDGKFYHPIAFLTCNFSPPSGEIPSLLTHDDVITLLHEFGHVLNHLLTTVDYPSIGGINGVEWDAVELPSQFMENFGWDKKYLDTMSGHYLTGEKIPDELFEKMLAAKNYNSGLATIRQMEFSIFDFTLHRNFNVQLPVPYMDVLNEVREKVSVMTPPEWSRFPNTFTHIFAGGYAAGYYSYMWAEVLSADAYEVILDQEDGSDKFRKHILSSGSVRSASVNYRNFAGRDPDNNAMLRSRGLVSRATK